MQGTSCPAEHLPWLADLKAKSKSPGCNRCIMDTATLFCHKGTEVLLLESKCHPRREKSLLHLHCQIHQHSWQAPEKERVIEPMEEVMRAPPRAGQPSHRQRWISCSWINLFLQISFLLGTGFQSTTIFANSFAAKKRDVVGYSQEHSGQPLFIVFYRHALVPLTATCSLTSYSPFIAKTGKASLGLQSCTHLQGSNFH